MIPSFINVIVVLVVVVVVVMLVLNAGPKDLVVQLTIHPIALKTILITACTVVQAVVYMGCSDVSEFEHIYGQILTTPSCVYGRLFT